MLRFIPLCLLLLASVTAFAQPKTNERINQIRADYSEAIELIKEQSGHNSNMNWNVQATVHRIEAGVGLAIYKDEYYHLIAENGYRTFYRCKRMLECNSDILYLEILYTLAGEPEFYLEKYIDSEGNTTEQRIYWNEDGTICRSTYSGEDAAEQEENALRYANLVMKKYETVLSEGLYAEEEEPEDY